MSDEVRVLVGTIAFGLGINKATVRAVIHMWFPSGETLYRVAFGDRNSSRLPTYHRLDVSGQRDFNLGVLKTTVGATLFNAYDHQNVAYTEYQVANEAVVHHDVLLMRRAVNVFLRFTF